MDIFVLLLFCTVLTVCVVFDVEILYALLAGLVIFSACALLKGFKPKALFKMIMSGVKTVRIVLYVLILIGILTALWRSCGTIPVIVCSAARLIRPGIFVLMAFLLNCGVSVLTGTAFGTAATMGVICMAMGNTMQIEPMLLGGAILAGSFFGDRCSPVSSSALLVSGLTGTDIYKNIRNMLRSALVPFCLSCAAYLLLGIFSRHSGGTTDVTAVFEKVFRLHPVAFIPAAVILILSLFKVNIFISMSSSIVASFFVSIFVQGDGVAETLKTAVFGFTADNAEVGAMVNGGGILSMLRVAAIVMISAAYAGIFHETGLLNSVQRFIKKLSEKTTPYLSFLFTAALTSMITCNQTLSIMLTRQLCSECEKNDETAALHIENSAVIISTVIPWAIGATVPLASVGAPLTSILFACFIYFLPAWELIVSFARKRKQTKKAA